MLTTRNGGVNLPYNDSDVVCAIQLAFKLSIKPGWHCFVSLRYVVNNNNITACCQIGQQNTVDHLSSGRYSSRAAAKSAAGIGVPKFTEAHNRAHAVFLLHCHTQIMVRRAGAPKGAPGSSVTGYANPVRLTTSEIGVSGGELPKLTEEAANMATIPTRTQPELLLVEGRAVTTSLAVAAYFSKRHDDVLKRIKNLECSPDFTARNFAVSEYSDPTGRTLPCYEITRDGFAFLAMGFTGKKAATFKESYINAFNRMETMLSGGSSPASALPGQIELLITLENGAVVDSRPVRKGELVACFETFIELAERRGFLVIHRDDLASLSFGVRRRGDS
ncbi:Rha family transcriptional regulator [Enterobacter hormaechei]|uniref:Rha family phage regulatory protein n=1 Tax=Enterobacter hormaechei TaxID=158836 RepID=UPI002A75ED6B|nr:Rha family transcriptional regulator [Enterobacter hormaechei]MDY3570249.1 Rha family transcriptional regulator [Enterobacter hormaechei]